MSWLWITSAQAATLSVGPGQAFGSLGDALAVAVAGDTVEVHPAVYAEDIDVPAEVSIHGIGDPDLIVVSGTGGPNVVTVLGEAILQGFTVDGLGVARGVLGGPNGDLVLRDLFDHNEATTAAALGVRGQDDFYFVDPVRAIVARNSFLGQIGDGPGSVVQTREDAQIRFQNNVVAATGGATGPAVQTVGPAWLDYNLWFDNAHGDVGGTSITGLGAVFADPLYTTYQPDADCTNDDLTPLAGSPVIDAGDPAFVDHDGTPSDIGHID